MAEMPDQKEEEMPEASTPTLVPLIDAAMGAGLTYTRLMRLVMLRKVRGERAGGRWFADPSDARRWADENQPVPAA